MISPDIKQIKIGLVSCGIAAGGDVGQLLVDRDGAGLDIHAQHTDIIVMLLQLRNQGFGIVPAGVKEFRKRHNTPSFQELSGMIVPVMRTTVNNKRLQCPLHSKNM